MLLDKYGTNIITLFCSYLLFAFITTCYNSGIEYYDSSIPINNGGSITILGGTPYRPLTYSISLLHSGITSFTDMSKQSLSYVNTGVSTGKDVFIIGGNKMVQSILYVPLANTHDGSIGLAYGGASIINEPPHVFSVHCNTLYLGSENVHCNEDIHTGFTTPSGLVSLSGMLNNISLEVCINPFITDTIFKSDQIVSALTKEPSILFNATTEIAIGTVYTIDPTITCDVILGSSSIASLSLVYYGNGTFTLQKCNSCTSQSNISFFVIMFGLLLVLSCVSISKDHTLSRVYVITIFYAVICFILIVSKDFIPVGRYGFDVSIVALWCIGVMIVINCIYYFLPVKMMYKRLYIEPMLFLILWVISCGIQDSLMSFLYSNLFSFLFSTITCYLLVTLPIVGFGFGRMFTIFAYLVLFSFSYLWLAKLFYSLFDISIIYFPLVPASIFAVIIIPTLLFIKK